jgi:PAS domain S-box-containing protein
MLRMLEVLRDRESDINVRTRDSTLDPGSSQAAIGTAALMSAESFKNGTFPGDIKEIEEDEFSLALLLAAIVESSDDAIISKDINGVIRSWNAGAERIFGYTAEEAIGRPISLLAVSEEKNEMPAILARLRRGERIDHYETTRRRKDGTIITVSLTVSPIRNSKGEVIGASKIARDITAQKEAERELLLLVEASRALLGSPQSSAVLSTIIEFAQHFVTADAHAVWRKRDSNEWYLASFSGLTERYVEASTELPGGSSPISTEPLILTDVQASAVPDARKELLRAEGIRSMLVIPLIINGEPNGTVAFYWRAPYSPSPAEIRVASALGNLGAAALGAADLYDRQIELRKRAESSERKSAFLVEAGTVLSSSLQYETTLANVAKLAVPVLADWCSVDIIDEKGNVHRVAVHHSDPEKIRFAYEFNAKYPPREDDISRVALRTGQSVLVEEIPDEAMAAHARDPEHLRLIRELGLVSLIIAPMVIGEKSLGIITFVSSESGRHFNKADLEIAEEIARRAATAISHARLYESVRASEKHLLHLNQELRRANDDLNQFAYTASHDLQEPLRMVAIYTELLERKYSSVLDDKARDYIRFSLQGAKRMEMLVKDLLAYSRVADFSEEEIPLVDTNAVLDKALLNLNEAIVESQASISRSGLPCLRITEVHLLQLFQNLIGNAIKYRKPDEPLVIEIACEAQPEFWKFQVSDNGIGISAAYLKQVFGIFKRLHSNEEYPGTGIGLAICQRIVERYDGRIWVESEEGKGSSFFFTLSRTE